MKLNVNTTQEIIDGSNHSAICSCPIAKSINRKLGEEPYPRITNSSVHLKDGHCTMEEQIEGKGIERTVYKFKLPEIAQKFVAKWDALETVEPIEFDLTLVKKGPLTCPFASI